MTMHRITNGESNVSSTDANSTLWNAISLAIKEAIRREIDRAGVFSADETDLWAEAFVDADGREDSVDIDWTTLEFDTNKYKVPDGPYVIIEATSLTESDFRINDCQIGQYETGKWMLWCDTGTDEVRRAQIYKTLFYGTSGADPKVTGITLPTALRTSVTRDVGKRAHFAEMNLVDSGSQLDGTYTGTFVDTSTNTDCSIWSKIRTDMDFVDGATIFSRAELPTGTTVNGLSFSSGGPGDSTVDEIGTDTSGDEDDNPAGVQFDEDTGATPSSTYAEAIILCAGDITWADVGDAAGSNTDFFTDESIPDFTAVSTVPDFIVTMDVPSGSFPAAIESLLGDVIVEDWEADADVQVKVIGASDDSGFLSRKEVHNFAAFSSEPTKFIVKCIPKVSTPTAGYPSVIGAGVRCE